MRVPIQLGSLLLDLDSGEVDQGAPLTGKELAVLRYLAERAGRVVPRDVLLHEVWGYNPSVLTRVVDLTISRLRRRLEPQPANPAFLKTVHGEGYVLLSVPATGEAPAPLDAGPFVGRAAELGFLLHWTAAPEGRWLTVVGAPGIGKSRLLRELRGTRHGAVLVPLGAARDVTTVVTAVCQALALRMDAFGDAAAWLARTLDQRALLLLLDDLDAVQGPADALRVSLAACPGVRVVATSRRALGFPGEPLLRLGPIAEDAARSLAALLGAPDAPIADAAGNPLALTLQAAAHRAGASPTQANVGLEGALRSSWDRLAPDDRRLLASLSLFAGRFEEEAAIEGFGTDGDALDRLVDDGLVEVWGERWGLHPAIRAFARRQLERAGEGESARARHAAFHLDDLAARLVVLRGPRRGEALGILLGRLDDLDAAWTRATAEGDLLRLGRALEAAEELVAGGGLWVHGERWFGLATEVPAASPSERVTFLIARAVCLGGLGAGARAWDELGRALVGAPEIPAVIRARALAARARVGVAVKPDLEVYACFEDAVTLARACGDRRVWLSVLLDSLLFRAGGDFRSPAEPEVDEALDAAQSLGDASLLAMALYIRGLWAIRLGRHGESRSAAADARRLLEGRGDAPPFAGILQWEAIACAMLGLHAEAEELFLRVEALHERHGAPLRLWTARRNRGIALLLMRARFPEAGALFGEVRDAARRLGFPRLEMSATEDLARVGVATCAWTEALVHGEEARRLRREHAVGATFNLGTSLGLARLEAGDPVGALEEAEAGLGPEAGRGDVRWDDTRLLGLLAGVARSAIDPSADASWVATALVDESRLPLGMPEWAVARTILEHDPERAGHVLGHALARPVEAPFGALLGGLRAALEARLGPTEAARVMADGAAMELGELADGRVGERARPTSAPRRIGN